MRIRLFIAIVTLLLCEIAAPAEQPIVIEDSEAAKYVGKVVEVRGRVVSVTTSPLVTTFINFGGEYPNQRFAGFIAAVQDNVRSATCYDPRENHQHHRQNRTSKRQARDQHRVGRSDQRVGFSTD
jgi:hypothetical protein